MAALAKKTAVHGASAWRGRTRPRIARDADQPQDSVVHAQQALLEAAFSEPDLKPYPAPIRIAILVGAPAVLWIGLFALAGRLMQG